MSAPEPAVVDATNRASLLSRLTSLRAESRLSLRQIAERTGYSHQTIWRIEQPGADPTIQQLQAYARAVNCRLAVSFRASVNSCEKCGWVGHGECPRGPGDHQ